MGWFAATPVRHRSAFKIKNRAFGAEQCASALFARWLTRHDLAQTARMDLKGILW